MKTTIYNLNKEIISAILVLVISTVGFAATQTHEAHAILAHNNSEFIMVNNEPVAPASGNLAESAAEANIKELSQRIGEWMSEGSYWESENSSELAEKELADNIESWIADGSYWAVTSHSHRAEAKLTNKIKDWMSNGSYWEINEK